MPAVEDLEVADDETALFALERPGPGMGDVDAGRADMTEAQFAGSQAIVDVLVIAARKILRERTERVETGAGDIKAEADAAWKIDDAVFVGGARGGVESADLVPRRKRVADVRLRKARVLAVVRERRDGRDARLRAGGEREPVDRPSRKDRVRVQEQRVALGEALKNQIDERAKPRLDSFLTSVARPRAA